MPGDFGCDRGDYARVVLLFSTRGCGRGRRPAFPTPSLGGGYQQNPGGSRRGNADAYLLFEN
jgi:hypothetical protein